MYKNCSQNRRAVFAGVWTRRSLAARRANALHVFVASPARCSRKKNLTPRQEARPHGDHLDLESALDCDNCEIAFVLHSAAATRWRGTSRSSPPFVGIDRGRQPRVVFGALCERTWSSVRCTGREMGSRWDGETCEMGASFFLLRWLL
jgi:hypothetical protein